MNAEAKLLGIHSKVWPTLIGVTLFYSFQSFVFFAPNNGVTVYMVQSRSNSLRTPLPGERELMFGPEAGNASIADPAPSPLTLEIPQRAPTDKAVLLIVVGKGQTRCRAVLLI